ncbi:MAG: hydrogenase maturation protease [Mycolicibacterium sp.]|uniref:hydrogenase maturation protease n=1 Tax=Mycolicibacterium sp. TaxID=2320850 RepID=UPI000FA11389|nr:hydrogenase maturation protease [Mycolicibacterium sp.]RUP27987.1 MAG: hydrogenase maturation protease [Mycolicibacterium sp.]
MCSATCACGGCDGGDATQRILVAGIGNIFLGDDGFGPEVLRHVGSAAPGVQTTDYGIRGMHLAYDLLAEWDALVLVDALPCRGAPGTVHVFEADHQSLTAAVGLDAHAMDPATVFASLNALGGHAPYTVVVGCEVEDVEERMGLSGVAAAAIPAATRAVEDVVAELRSRSPVREG